MSSGLHVSHGQDLFPWKTQTPEGTLSDRRKVMLRGISHRVTLSASVQSRETGRPPFKLHSPRGITSPGQGLEQKVNSSYEDIRQSTPKYSCALEAE